MSRARVRIELGTRDECDRHWRDYLSKGGAYLTGEAPADLEVTIVLVRGAAELELDGKAVYRMAAGTGYELLGWSADKKAEVEAWLQAEPDAEPDANEDARRHGVPSLAERIRNLPVHQQTRLAREGDQRERVMLERMYGKQVWEALLRNPRITFPEVARIARMGTIPQPLMELIVNNAAWLRSPEIRRALLANLRLGAEMIPRVLRMLPKHELRLVPTQTAYPPVVRDLARKLLKGATVD
jgi:hypothetical protein